MKKLLVLLLAFQVTVLSWATPLLAIAAQDLIEDSLANDLGIESLCVFQHGALIFDEYLKGTREDSRPVFHIANTFVSCAIGICIDQGLIEGVDQPILDFFPEYASKTEHTYHQQVNIEHLLTMTAGYKWQSEHHNGPIKEFVENPDLEEYIFSLGFISVPGERYWQNSGCVYLLTRIIEIVSGENFEDFVKRNIFDPLEMRNALVRRDIQGVSKGPYAIELTTLELVRFGQFILQQGTYNGNQLISSDWIAQITRLQFPLNPLADVYYRLGEEGIGYYWWIFDGMYITRGHSGQYLFVVPGSNAVVAVTAKARMSVPAELYLSHLKAILNPGT